MESDKQGELNKIDTVKNEEKLKDINNGSHKIVIQNDLQNEKSSFCTNDMKKHVSILFILLFVLIFLMSSAAFIIITFTNRFNENIVENLVLRNGSKSLEWWIDSPIKPLLKVHIFNYTNIDEILRGSDEKIKVEDVGPYVYEETLQRVKLTYLDGNKITFYENRTQKFLKQFTPSHLSEEDNVYVPNIPLILGIHAVENDATKNFLFKGLLSSVGPKEFQTKTVKEFLYGYTDSFINAIALSLNDFRQEKVGILGARKGVSTDNLTIFTGEDDLDNLGKVYAMNDEANMTIWSTDECNTVKGTDGTQFSLSDLADERPLEIWAKSICRPFTLEFDREVTVLNGIPAKRYIPEPNSFGSSRTNENNQCYCDSEFSNKCPPDGVFDAEKCIGVQLLMSYPHFYEGDEILLEPFEGLRPNKEEHQTFADIHPRMAFPIGGASRMQLNIRLKRKTYGIFPPKTLYRNLPEDLILPICWFEITAGEVPAELLAMVFNTTHSANATYLTIQYGSIICMFVSFLLTISTAYIYFKRIVGESSGKMKCQDMFSMLSTHPSNSQNQNIYPSLSAVQK